MQPMLYILLKIINLQVLNNCIISQDKPHTLKTKPIWLSSATKINGNINYSLILII